MNSSEWDIEWFNFTTWNKIVADFTYTINNNLVTFTDTSWSNDPANCSINSWYWDFGDGSTSEERNPRHYFRTNNDCDVTLTVENLASHTIDSTTKTIPRYVAPPATSYFDFDWFMFFVPMVIILVIIMLFIILFDSLSGVGVNAKRRFGRGTPRDTALPFGRSARGFKKLEKQYGKRRFE